jgi:hypothetical protein
MRIPRINCILFLWWASSTSPLPKKNLNQALEGPKIDSLWQPSPFGLVTRVEIRAQGYRIWSDVLLGTYLATNLELDGNTLRTWWEHNIQVQIPKAMNWTNTKSLGKNALPLAWRCTESYLTQHHSDGISSNWSICFFYTWKHVWNTILFEYLYERFFQRKILGYFRSSKEHKQLWYQNLHVTIHLSIYKIVGFSYVHGTSYLKGKSLVTSWIGP